MILLTLLPRTYKCLWNLTKDIDKKDHVAIILASHSSKIASCENLPP